MELEEVDHEKLALWSEKGMTIQQAGKCMHVREKGMSIWMMSD